MEITTIEEYQHLVDEALIEVDELSASIDFDGEYMEMQSHFVAPITETLQQLKQELADDSHQFGGIDLSYMSFVATIPTEILPFKYLLKIINNIHKNAQF